MKPYAPLLLATCFYLSQTAYAESSVPLSKLFDEKNACFILINARTEKTIERYGGEQCTQRNSPCSTFKVPLAVMGFDSGVLKDANTVFKWDGTKHFLKTWEKDQSATSWMRESVVWYSQIIARKLGKEKMAKYLKDFKYGNEDMSGGLETAWLSVEPSPKSANEPSIKISAEEQLGFWSKLWRNQLLVSKDAMQKAQALTYWETSPKGYELFGKTGSGYVEKKSRKRLGWYVARLVKGDDEYLAVLSFSDQKEPAQKAGYAGPESRELFKDIIKTKGLW